MAGSSFPPEKRVLNVIVNTVELIGPRTLSLGPEETRECERRFCLPERGDNLSYLLVKIASYVSLLLALKIE